MTKKKTPKKKPKAVTFKTPRKPTFEDLSIRASKTLLASELAEIISWIITSSSRDMEIVLDDIDQPIIKRWAAAVCARAIFNGSAKEMDILFDRVLGKSKEKLEVTAVTTNAQISIYDKMSVEERRAAIKQFQIELDIAGED